MDSVVKQIKNSRHFIFGQGLFDVDSLSEYSSVICFPVSVMKPKCLGIQWTQLLKTYMCYV